MSKFKESVARALLRSHWVRGRVRNLAAVLDTMEAPASAGEPFAPPSSPSAPAEAAASARAPEPPTPAPAPPPPTKKDPPPVAQNFKDPGFWPWFRARSKFTTLIDVGAHDGAFAVHLCNTFGVKSAVLFEPLPQMREQIESRLDKLPRDTRVVYAAVSDKTGETTMYVSGYAPASSLTRPTRAQTDAFPHAATVGEIKVQVVRLDDALAGAPLARPCLLKIDAEGHENEILDAAAATLAQVDSIYIEVSYEQRFEGGSDFESIFMRLSKAGFVFAGLANQVHDLEGRPLFAHFLFDRRPAD